jgi:hypothetical protein
MMTDIDLKNALGDFEPFVDAVVAGGYLGLHPETVRRKARKGILPGHPLGEGKRKKWRFLLSELDTWLRGKPGDMTRSVESRTDELLDERRSSAAINFNRLRSSRVN